MIYAFTPGASLHIAPLRVSHQLDIPDINLDFIVGVEIWTLGFNSQSKTNRDRIVHGIVTGYDICQLFVNKNQSVDFGYPVFTELSEFISHITLKYGACK